MRPPAPERFDPARAACAIALLVAFAASAAPARAHGGAYNPIGPGSTGMRTPPTGPGPSAGSPAPVPTGTPLPGMRPATDAISPVATWEDWWHFNKDPFLDLKRAVGTGGPATAADEIVSGKPRASPSVPGAVRSRVVPALRALVETEKSTEVVGGSMIALARADDGGSDEATERTIPLLVKRLADSSQEIAETAALSLGILGSEESLPILEALVLNGPAGRKLVGEHDVSDRTRAFAAYGLGLVAHQSATNRGRQLAARALCAAIEGTRASAPDVEIAAVIALSLGPLDAERAPSSSAPWISRQTEVRFLQKIVADPRRRSLVRAHAVTALARLAQGAPPELAADVVEQLLGLLRAHAKLENEVLQSCAQALGLLGDADGDLLDRKIRSALGTLSDDPDSQTRCFALVALAQVGSRPSASGAGGEEEGSLVCRNLITGEIVRGRGQTRPWAAIALGVLERRIQDRIGTGAGGDDEIVSGARSGLTPSKASREILRKYFASAKQRTHIGAGALALGLCRDRKAVPILIERLRETTEDQGQGKVALALGMIGSPDAVAPLSAVAKSSKYRPELLEEVATALALVGNKPTSVEMAELLMRAQGQAAQVSYANALGHIGDERAIDPLLDMVGRPALTSSARGFAAAALGQVADGDRLPWSSVISTDLNYQARAATLIAGDGSGLLEIL